MPKDIGNTTTLTFYATGQHKMYLMKMYNENKIFIFMAGILKIYVFPLNGAVYKKTPWSIIQAVTTYFRVFSNKLNSVIYEADTFLNICKLMYRHVFVSSQQH